jgi:hypothetical protein
MIIAGQSYLFLSILPKTYLYIMSSSGAGVAEAQERGQPGTAVPGHACWRFSEFVFKKTDLFPRKPVKSFTSMGDLSVLK